MSLLMLIIANLLLVLGMLTLPSLLGGGTSGVFTRVWLFFGLLVFLAHYFRYFDSQRVKKDVQPGHCARAHLRAVRLRERSEVHR